METGVDISNFSEDDKDEIYVLRLELMDKLIRIKKDMEASLREGFFLLGKSRYIMGANSVGELQIPSSDCEIEARYNTSVCSQKMEEFPTLECLDFSVHLNSSILNAFPKESLEISEDESEVKRRGDFSRKTNSDLSNISSQSPRLDSSNPLNWFSALPPQSLREAQHHFKQAVLKSVECATMQSKLNALNV